MKDTRQCREHKFAPGYEDWGKVNCASCETWCREKGRCRDINGVKLSIAKRYEETSEYDIAKKMMESNKGVYLG